jgi:hypothetical protein
MSAAEIDHKLYAVYGQNLMTALHNFRSFMWIAEHFTNSSRPDYHS